MLDYYDLMQSLQDCSVNCDFPPRHLMFSEISAELANLPNLPNISANHKNIKR